MHCVWTTESQWDIERMRERYAIKALRGDVGPCRDRYLMERLKQRGGRQCRPADTDKAQRFLLPEPPIVPPPWDPPSVPLQPDMPEPEPLLLPLTLEALPDWLDFAM